jgi:hypothetical protein
MVIDGKINVNALLDSGNPDAVLYSPDLVKKQHLNILGEEAYAGGVGGYEIVRCGTLQNLAIGPIQYVGQGACESASFSGDDILVGFDFLKHFNIVFDYPQAQLILEPIKE